VPIRRPSRVGGVNPSGCLKYTGDRVRPSTEPSGHRRTKKTGGTIGEDPQVLPSAHLVRQARLEARRSRYGWPDSRPVVLARYSTVAESTHRRTRSCGEKEMIGGLRSDRPVQLTCRHAGEGMGHGLRGRHPGGIGRLGDRLQRWGIWPRLVEYAQSAQPSHAVNPELEWAIGCWCTSSPRDRKQQVQDR
jgi:hypothetical protein